MSEWRENVGEERPGLSLGDLENDSLTVTFLGEGRMTETRYGEALEIGVRLEEAPDGYQTMNEEAAEVGEEYNLYSSSNRFMAALKEFAETLEGATAEISGYGDNFERSYTVSQPDN